MGKGREVTRQMGHMLSLPPSVMWRYMVLSSTIKHLRMFYMPVYASKQKPEKHNIMKSSLLMIYIILYCHPAISMIIIHKGCLILHRNSKMTLQESINHQWKKFQNKRKPITADHSLRSRLWSNSAKGAKNNLTFSEGSDLSIRVQ